LISPFFLAEITGLPFCVVFFFIVIVHAEVRQFDGIHEWCADLKNLALAALIVTTCDIPEIYEKQIDFSIYDLKLISIKI
jgi:hypothetical protein